MSCRGHGISSQQWKSLTKIVLFLLLSITLCTMAKDLGKHLLVCWFSLSITSAEQRVYFYDVHLIESFTGHKLLRFLELWQYLRCECLGTVHLAVCFRGFSPLLFTLQLLDLGKGNTVWWWVRGQAKLFIWFPLVSLGTEKERNWGSPLRGYS